MLQWMGGSRKKVTTTRKSIQKRQKQYFEQRRRQQQMSGLVEGYKGGAGGSQLGLNSRQHRSLDVISLANLATPSQQHSPDCFSPVNGKGNSAHVRSEADYHTSEEPVLVANNVNSADPVELDDGSPSCYLAETASSNKVFHSQNSDGNTYGGITNKSQLSKPASEQQYSLIDLLDYDEPNKHLKGKDMRESHVAFSVQGVGKIEAETPPLSPQQPDRYVSYGCNIPLKFGRQPSSSDILSSELNEFGLEMEAMMQDFPIPSRNSMEFSNAKKEQCDVWKHYSPVVKDPRKFGGHLGEIGTSFSNRRIFGGTRTEDLFDASGINGGTSNTFWKDEPFKTDNNSDFVVPIDEMPGYYFGGSHLQKKRFASETTERFNISEIPASKQRVSEDDYDFDMEDKSRHYSLGTDFDFSNKTCKPEWPCCMAEDARDSLRSLSEESTSSTAVRDDTKRGLLSKSKSEHCRRHQNTVGRPRKKYSAENIFAEGWHDDNGDEIEYGNNEYISGKPGHIPTQSKTAFSLDCWFQNRGEPNGSQFEEGCSSPHMTSGIKSAFYTDEMKLPPAPSKCWTDDAFAAWDQEGYADSKVPLPRSCADGSKKSASASFISENLSFLQPSGHSFSRVEFRSTAQDFSAHSPNCELRGKPPDSSGGAVYPRENSVPDLIAPRNKDKEEADYSKYFQENVKVQREVTAAKNWEPIDFPHCRENSSECEEAKNGTSDTTSSVNIPDRSETAMDEKEAQYDAEVNLACQNEHEDHIVKYHHDAVVNLPRQNEHEVHIVRSQHDAEVNLPCQNEHEEIEDEKRGGRNATTVMKRPSFFVGSSSQVMILQSYVFQLLCVQK